MTRTTISGTAATWIDIGDGCHTLQLDDPLIELAIVTSDTGIETAIWLVVGTTDDTHVLSQATIGLA